jgi:hypothetical protein
LQLVPSANIVNKIIYFFIKPFFIRSISDFIKKKLYFKNCINFGQLHDIFTMFSNNSSNIYKFLYIEHGI